MKYNSVTIAPVRSLEVGDLIALPNVGRQSVLGGKITGIVSSPFQLTDEQRAYMMEKKLEIPEDENASITGASSLLLFGDFSNHPSHIYLDYDTNVAVFPTKE